MNGTAEWDKLPSAEQAALKARQGVRYPVLEALDVLDPETMEPVPRDGKTLGEVMFRGNVVMKGYLKNKSASEKAFAGGWFHSGDLGVMYPDGYIQLKDRSKDIIISGGENISSIEVEDALYKHPGGAGGGGGGQARREMGRDALRLHRTQARQDRNRRGACRLVQEKSRRLQGAAIHRVRGIAEDQYRQDPEIQIAGSRQGSVSDGAQGISYPLPLWEGGAERMHQHERGG